MTPDPAPRIPRVALRSLHASAGPVAALLLPVVWFLCGAGPPPRSTGEATPGAQQKSSPPASGVNSQRPAAEATGREPASDLPRQLFSGQVVLLQEALKKRGILSRDEFQKQAALETAEGELIPIIPDWRGRAFFQDSRLRNRKVELVAIRRDKVPFLQVLMVFAFDEKGTRQYVDYWCDICAIPMYEIKPCECCQDTIRLRFQPQPLPSYLDVKRPATGKSSAKK